MKNKHVNFEVTSKCNQKCIYCFNAYRRENIHDLSFKKIKKILLDLKNKNIKSVLFTGGEPFSRNDMINILKFSLEIGLKTSILSNGFKIKSLVKQHLELFKQLGTIQISLDTFDKNKLNKIRGYNNAYDDALSALEELLKYNIQGIEISSVFNVDNKSDILNIAKYSHENKIKLILRNQYSEIDKNSITIQEYLNLQFKIETLYPNVLIKDKFSYVTDKNITISSDGSYIKQVA